MRRRPIWPDVPRAFLAFLSIVLAWSFSAPLQADLNRSMVAYYPLDFDASDASGHGNHAVALGAPVLAPGIRGLAVAFDGIDDVLQTPRSIEGDFSVAFWVQTTAAAPVGTEWWQGFGLVDGEVCGSPPGGDWGIALLNGGHVAWGGIPFDLTSTSELNDGLWHAVVLTRELATGLVTLFIDGLEDDSAIAAPITPFTAPDWIGLGNNPCDTGFGRLFFPGRIDEVRYYERVLSPAEAAALSDDWIHFDDFESGDLGAWGSP